MADALLEVNGLSSGYGGIPVLHDLSFTLESEIFAILGSNGAGKTTLLATLASLLPIYGGSVTALGNDITHMPAPDASRLGIGYVPQEKAVFPDLTIMENLQIGGMIGNRPFEERLEGGVRHLP